MTVGDAVKQNLAQSRPDSGVPIEDMNQSGKMRRRLLSRERLILSGPQANVTKKEVQSLHLVRSELVHLGFDVEKTTGEPYTHPRHGRLMTPVVWQLTNPWFRPPEEAYAKAATRYPSQTSGAKKAARKTKVKVTQTDIGPDGKFHCPCGKEYTTAGGYRDHLQKTAHQRGGQRAPDPAVPQEPVERQGLAQVDAMTVLEQALNGSYVPMSVMAPNLGDAAQVFMLLLDDDGAVKVGIRNGDGRWIARVEGFVG